MTKRQLEQIAVLMKRIRNATSKHGKKSELARYLGTSPQGLNDWLALRFEPGGEVTLLMLEWVTAEEAKQTKTVAVLQTPPRRKTRKTQSSYEKSKRVRKRE